MFKIGQYIIRYYNVNNIKNQIIWQIIDLSPLKGIVIHDSHITPGHEINTIHTLKFAYDLNTEQYTITNNIDKYLTKLL